MGSERAIRASKENTSLPVICPFSFEPGIKGCRTMMGVKPERAAKTAAAAGPDVVGANCGNGISNMIEITRLMRAAVPTVPLLVHAKAGPPVVENGQPVVKETPDHMASCVSELWEAGAILVVDSWRSSPYHIIAFP